MAYLPIGANCISNADKVADITDGCPTPSHPPVADHLAWQKLESSRTHLQTPGFTHQLRALLQVVEKLLLTSADTGVSRWGRQQSEVPRTQEVLRFPRGRLCCCRCRPLRCSILEPTGRTGSFLLPMPAEGGWSWGRHWWPCFETAHQEPHSPEKASALALIWELFSSSIQGLSLQSS